MPGSTVNSRYEQIKAAGLNAFNRPSAFEPIAAGHRKRVEGVKADLAKQVRAGDLTAKQARAQLRDVVREAGAIMASQAAAHSPVPAAFRGLLMAEVKGRPLRRNEPTAVDVGKQTNALLGKLLAEIEVGHRQAELQARGYATAVPGGKPVANADRLIRLKEWAERSGDPAAELWARRELENMKESSLVTDENQMAQIERALVRDDEVSIQRVKDTVRAMEHATDDRLDVFVTQAYLDGDASAVAACWLVAQDRAAALQPGEPWPAWVSRTIDGVLIAPDAALAFLRGVEADQEAAAAENVGAHMTAAQLRMDQAARMEEFEPDPAAVPDPFNMQDQSIPRGLHGAGAAPVALDRGANALAGATRAEV